MIALAWVVAIVGGLLAGMALERAAHRARVFDDLVDYQHERRRRDLNDQDNHEP